jgi:hypothetical protein
VSTDQNQVFQNAFRLKSIQVLNFQMRGVKALCIIAFNGVWVSGSMDRANVESSDLKGYTFIAVGSMMVCNAN